MNLTTSQPRVSVIVPIYNEEENLDDLILKTHGALDQLGQEYEIILVDDGSSDHSAVIMDRLDLEHPFVRAIHLRRNYGQTAAMMAGFDHARGDILVPMDGDLQNDPADIGRLLSRLDEGFDVVSGWRKDRQDSFHRVFLSNVANGLISRISGVKLHDYGCSLKAYCKEALEAVRLYGEMHRLIPIYAYWNGARVTEIPVDHHPRTRGVSKYFVTGVMCLLLGLATEILTRIWHESQDKPTYRPAKIFRLWLYSGATHGYRGGKQTTRGPLDAIRLPDRRGGDQEILAVSDRTQ